MTQSPPNATAQAAVIEGLRAKLEAACAELAEERDAAASHAREAVVNQHDLTSRWARQSAGACTGERLLCN
jgi:hypothetical protein